MSLQSLTKAVSRSHPARPRDRLDVDGSPPGSARAGCCKPLRLRFMAAVWSLWSASQALSGSRLRLPLRGNQSASGAHVRLDLTRGVTCLNRVSRSAHAMRSQAVAALALGVSVSALAVREPVSARDVTPIPNVFSNLTGCGVPVESCQQNVTNTCCSPTPGGLQLITQVRLSLRELI